MAAMAVDIYPAEVVLPNGEVHRGVRAMIDRADRVVVWRDNTGIAQPVYVGQVVDSGRYPERGAFWMSQRVVATTAHGQLTVNASGPRGCNCGNAALGLLDERSFEQVVGA